MANEAALKFLNEKITALQIIAQELRRLHMKTADLDLADEIRADITSLNPVLFALESAQNSLQATANEVPPPPEARVQELTAALKRLDRFVTNDQNIRAAVDFLIDIANEIRNA